MCRHRKLTSQLHWNISIWFSNFFFSVWILGFKNLNYFLMMWYHINNNNINLLFVFLSLFELWIQFLFNNLILLIIPYYYVVKLYFHETVIEINIPQVTNIVLSIKLLFDFSKLFTLQYNIIIFISNKHCEFITYWNSVAILERAIYINYIYT